MYYETAEKHVQIHNPGVTLPPPVQVSLNKNNIIQAQKSILDAYRYDDPSFSYQKLVQSPFYSVMHDGINKFGAEFIGVYFKGIDSNNKPFCEPYCLTRMKGGVNAFDTANEIIANICSFNSLGDSNAFHTINNDIKECFPHDIYPPVDHVPPSYFKMGKIMNVVNNDDEKQINIAVDDRFPIGNTGDGVYTNSKAARVLRDLYGIHTPEYRCSAHAASGSIKRLTTSKTMNVPDVTTLYECLRKFVKHFESSIKNKELLDEALEILESSPLHLISWCQTRMAHFLKAAKVFDDMIPAIYDVMYTKDV